MRLNCTYLRYLHIEIPGPSCSKLTMSLVNVSLKFQTLILQIHCYFLLKKCVNHSHIFSTKHNSVFVTLADICLKNLCLNDIVKLTMLKLILAPEFLYLHYYSIHITLTNHYKTNLLTNHNILIGINTLYADLC